jgi:putative holliday junction resolvase
MRTLAVDYGTRRIGVAVSDALGLTARGVTTLRGLGDRAAIDRVVELAAELDAEAIVVGLPLRADGSVGDAADRVLRFVGRLRAAVAIPIHTIGEWLTSFEAEERMRESGMKRDERRRRVDEAAAVVMLEEYLAGLDRAKEQGRDG